MAPPSLVRCRMIAEERCCCRPRTIKFPCTVSPYSMRMAAHSHGVSGDSGHWATVAVGLCSSFHRTPAFPPSGVLKPAMLSPHSGHRLDHPNNGHSHIHGNIMILRHDRRW
ncbi:hypothetical protein BGW80DRAFT_519794 [Lactifluus volemus]|nr:hypothetical protein BGW80DRAFT_519794 [Lactifluus volemus]